MKFSSRCWNIALGFYKAHTEHTAGTSSAEGNCTSEPAGSKTFIKTSLKDGDEIKMKEKLYKVS